jgi:hypothetical protein
METPEVVTATANEPEEPKNPATQPDVPEVVTANEFEEPKKPATQPDVPVTANEFEEPKNPATQPDVPEVGTANEPEEPKNPATQPPKVPGTADKPAPGASNLEELHKSTCGSVNTRLPDMEPDIVYPLDYANDPFLKDLWETTLTNLKNASKPLEILEAIASTAMLEGYIAKFVTSILEGIVSDDDMRDMLVNGIKTFTTTKLAGLSLEQYGKVSKIIENSASSPDLAMLMIQQLGKAMVKPDAKAIRNKLKKLNTNCDEEAAQDAAALEIQKSKMAKAAEDKKKEEDAKEAILKEKESARVLRGTDLKEKYKESEKKKAEKKLADEKKANESSFFSMFRSNPKTEETKSEADTGAVKDASEANADETKVDNGTKEVVNETKEVVNETKEVDNGTKEVDNGTKEVDNGTKEVENGTKEVENGTKEVDNETEKTGAEPKVTSTEASIQEENKEENKEKVKQADQTVGGRTRRKRVSARKTRKHWLLFTLRDIL